MIATLEPADFGGLFCFDSLRSSIGLTWAAAKDEHALRGQIRSAGGASSRGGNQGRAGDVVNVNQFQVTELAGVEYHNIGDVPAEFKRTAGGCGVLLLKTTTASTLLPFVFK